MTDKKSLLPVEHIEKSILLIRGQKVLLDADLRFRELEVPLWNIKLGRSLMLLGNL